MNEFEIKEAVGSRRLNDNEESDSLRDKIKSLEEDLMNIQNKNNIILSQNKQLKDEINDLEARLSSRGSLTFEGETSKNKSKDIDHVKDILLKFVRETPVTSKGNEQLLLIVFSMLYLSKPQMDEIQKCRKQITEQYETEIMKRNKKGMFGGFFGRRDKSK